MHHGVQLRPLIPKTVSQMRPEPFQIEAKRTFEDKPPVNFRGPLGISEKAEQEFDRRSLGQKKRRHREKKNRKCVRAKAALLDGPMLVNPRRSAAQRGRRQRELTKQIQGLLQTKSPDNIRSRAQTLRRRVEEAARRLEFDAVCDPTEALNQVLDKEFEINNPRRENRYRPSRREQILGSEEYRRLLSVAKQSERERRECEAQHS
ncbi:hypothetical protein DFH09DRAFT_1102508 [Mycena vulgaris]|nr:hypothetical protein DFH09DRAFT_1102508 [Mycena vulgaris]